MKKGFVPKSCYCKTVMHNFILPVFMIMAALLTAAILAFILLRKRLGSDGDEEKSPESIILSTPTSTMREFARAEVRLPVMITTADGREAGGESRNISASGIFIACAMRIPPDSICDIKILSAAGGPIEFKGRVTWSNQHLPEEKVIEAGVGFGFFALAPEIRKKLQRLLQANLGDR